MNRKIKKELIIILSILLLIVILLVSIVAHLRKKEEGVNTPAMPAEELEEFIKENKILTYKNLTKISFIEGLTSSEVIEKLEDIITKYIPELYNTTKDFQKDELKSYYEQNQKFINKKLTISSENEFLELINNLKNLQTEVDLYEYCEYLEDESEINLGESKSTYALIFDVYYRNGNSFKFCLNISKNSK